MNTDGSNLTPEEIRENLAKVMASDEDGVGHLCTVRHAQADTADPDAVKALGQLMEKPQKSQIPS
jgi:hypothetical protein